MGTGATGAKDATCVGAEPHAGRICLAPPRGVPNNPTMQQVVTLTERKAAEASRRQHAVALLKSALATYAKDHRGRFLLFGSAARGDMRFDSDVDILVDFSAEHDAAAWDFAERACWERNLEPDLMRRAWCKSSFLEHIARDIVTLE